jgi:hypothetical protein
VCLAILALASASSRAAEPPLAEKAQAVLKTYCARCHGGVYPAKGGFNYVLDRDQLVARDAVVPGKPLESPLFARIRKGEMPPEGQKRRPTAEEIILLQQWIEAGAPAVAVAPGPRPFLSENAVVRSIRDDLQTIPVHQRRFARYFTLTTLYNAGRPEDELQTYRQALGKLLNSLSWHPRLTLPLAIDVAKTVYRIDLRAYQWDARLWDRLLSFYPYRLPNTSVEANAIAAATGSELSFVRADWFLATASQAPLYYDLLQFPTNDRELERQLRVDVLRDIEEETALRAGFLDSGVAKNNRLLERHDSAYGAYWRSYDFSDNIDRQNIFDHPLGPAPGQNSFVQAGGEIIFNLPNGLQAYMLVDGNGRRVDRAAVEIVSDPNRPDRFVQSGVSCMNCHSRGILPKADQIRTHVEKNPSAFATSDLDTVKALYPRAAKLQTLVEGDTARYQKALAQTGVAVDKPDPISLLTLRYEGTVDLNLAAAETDLEPIEFARRLRQSLNLTRVLGPLLVKGGTVGRQVFLTAFPDLLRDLGLGNQAGAGETPATASAYGRPFAGHEGLLTCIAFAPDGMRALSGSEDKTARLWDVAKGIELRGLAGHSGEVLAVAFAPDGGHALTGSQDRTVRLWDLTSGRELRSLTGHTDKVTTVAFSPDGRHALSGSWDQTLRLWDLDSGAELHRFAGHTSWLTSVAFSPDGRLALSGSYDHTVRIWDLAKKRELRRLQGHTREVYAVAFSPDGKWALSGGNDHSARLWDVMTGKEQRRFDAQANAIIAVAFTADGRDVLTGSSQYQGRDKTIRLWEAATGRELAAHEGSSGTWCVAFARNGKQALTGSTDKSLLLWNLAK